MNSRLFVILLVSPCSLSIAEEPIRVDAARRDERGILVHEAVSTFQAGSTQIRVLTPDPVQPQRRYPAIYVLPVEARREHRFGDGLAEIQTHDLHNKHQAIFVAPTFSHLPWYADHPTDATIRQEAYLLGVVVPFVEKSYPVAGNAQGRLLLGFSKSGWGAWSLLLRHPEVFGRAAAWDAPLMMDQLGKYGTTSIFGSEENFSRYSIAGTLRPRAAALGGTRRLFLLGYDNFRQDHQQIHQLLEELRVPHEYRDGPLRKHNWHSGWVSEAVELLLGEGSR